MLILKCYFKFKNFKKLLALKDRNFLGIWHDCLFNWQPYPNMIQKKICKYMHIQSCSYDNNLPSSTYSQYGLLKICLNKRQSYERKKDIWFQDGVLLQFRCNYCNDMTDLNWCYAPSNNLRTIYVVFYKIKIKFIGLSPEILFFHAGPS